MSARNGDRARFQLQRKAGLKRRERSRLAAATLGPRGAGVVTSVPDAEAGRSTAGSNPPVESMTKAV